jgi:hypothetical protein
MAQAVAFAPGGLLPPAFEGRVHFGFGVDAQCVGDAIDVIEVGDDFRRVQDVAVAEAVPAKRVNIMPANGRGRSRDELGKLCQGFAARRKLRLAIIILYQFGQLGIAAFPTEILPVRFRSIEAVVGTGNYDGQQFTFGARKARGTVHGGQVETHRSLKSLSVQALDLQDVEDLAGAGDGPDVFILQLSGCVPGLNHFDPCHNGLRSAFVVQAFLACGS